MSKFVATKRKKQKKTFFEQNWSSFLLLSVAAPYSKEHIYQESQLSFKPLFTLFCSATSRPVRHSSQSSWQYIAKHIHCLVFINDILGTKLNLYINKQLMFNIELGRCFTVRLFAVNNVGQYDLYAMILHTYSCDSTQTSLSHVSLYGSK